MYLSAGALTEHLRSLEANAARSELLFLAELGYRVLYEGARPIGADVVPTNASQAVNTPTAQSSQQPNTGAQGDAAERLDWLNHIDLDGGETR